MRPLMSSISREKRALLWPRATMSKDCSSGTPAFIIVASWRVKNVMSFSVTFLPPRKRLPLELGDADALAAQRVVTTVSARP